jgi:hypothetical protein
MAGSEARAPEEGKDGKPLMDADRTLMNRRRHESRSIFLPSDFSASVSRSLFPACAA